MINAIEDREKKFQIVWDLGRRCTYSCSYCPPNRRNKTSPLYSLEELKKNMINLDEYISIMDMVRKDKVSKGLSFTGGEPTIHPDFFKFLKWIKEEYPEYNRAITTNGVFSKKILEQCKQYTTGGTISYHAEGTQKEKDMVIHNILELGKNYKYKVNVMFHKDYFDECVELCDTLKKEGIPYVPRTIGDAENDKSDVALGYAHVYTKDQMEWFRNFWKKPKKSPAPKKKGEGETKKDLGRPCCGNRVFKVQDENDWTETKFLDNTNFNGWNCLVNWYFIYINQELDLVWTHQTCGVNLEGDVAPLGKWSEFNKVVDELEEHILENQSIPMIRCPKIFCGCGMCITKAKDDISSIELFNNAISNQIRPIIQKEHKVIKYDDEKTTGWAFKKIRN